MTSDPFLPMFPLGTPLLPGSLLPLQIFELRYQMMLDDCLAAPTPEFGVVLIERGHEVGGGDQRSRIGTVARIVRVVDLEGDRRGVVALGERRIHVEEWLPDDPYPRAVVTDWPDEESESSNDGSPTGDRPAVRAVVEVARRILELVGDPPPELRIEVEPRADERVGEFAYRLASLMPIGPADRQRILGAPSAASRIVALQRALDDARAMIEFRLGPTR